MVSEKIHAAFEANTRLMAGASGDEIIHPSLQPRPPSFKPILPCRLATRIRGKARP
jgi:hypothetical protein